MQKNNFWDNPRIKNGKERLLIFVEVLVIAFCAFNFYFTGKIYPNTFVAGINLGGKNEREAIEILSKSIALPETMKLVNSNQTFEITKDSIDLSFDLATSVKKAFDIHRTGNILYDLEKRTSSLFKKNYLGIELTKNEEKLRNIISTVSDQVEVTPVYPSLKVVDNKASLDKGSVGYILDKESLTAKIGYNFSFANGSDILIPLLKVDPTLTEDEASEFLQRGENLVNKKLAISYDNQTFNYQKESLFAFLDPRNIYNNQKISEVVSEIANKLDHEPVNSVFVFEEGKVKEFTPSKDGVKVSQDLLTQMITGNLRTLEETETQISSINVPVTLTPPDIKNSDVNNLGIKELIGRGVSYFAGSIPGRIHNINLASSKFKGVLVKPGETLSFVKIVGDISQDTGYKQAYIISGGKTILGDGGGVCQVSTTLFRAALNAGLPITERTAHAYRVGYYEQGFQPGFDATVFSPTVDLKIKNDTENHILIQTAVDVKNNKLTFDIYGTKDGRISKVSKATIANQIAPPADVYQDDPTLPQGKVVQTEHKAWGATVSFNYQVEKDGKTVINKTFTSRYQPWAAVYLRGTAPI